MKMTSAPRHFSLATLMVLVMLAGCPRTAPPVSSDATASAAQSQASAPATAPRPAPRMSDPLPPQAMPQPVKLDNSCRVDGDCTVKDVGSCCGAFLACVNKDSAADPTAVKAQCAKDGRSSTCASRNLTSCGCQQGHCVPRDKTPVGGWIDDPAPPPTPVR